ncbi:MAG: hypothetical protein EOO10_20830 [Chitinophagaceae bacterium]|nr:MAG: hypothetical protein EOO10_20830 [Chitinophagaceae bacterium]
MKKKIEAEVDFIGGAGQLTKDEEKLISDFINARKKKVHSKERIAQHGLGKKAAARTYAHR